MAICAVPNKSCASARAPRERAASAAPNASGSVALRIWMGSVPSGGRYDADPMKIQHDRDGIEREQQRADPANLLPAEVAKSVSADTGQPVMFPPRGDLVWGLSTKPAS